MASQIQVGASNGTQLVFTNGGANAATLTSSANTLTFSSAGGNTALAGIGNITSDGTINTTGALQVGGAAVATQAYVQAQLDGRHWKQAVVAATTTALPANTLSSGVLTGNANGALMAMDGVTLSLNDRVLIKNEAAGAKNGIYTLTALGDAGNPYEFTRAADADTGAQIHNAAVVVQQGTTNGNTQYVNSNDAEPTIDVNVLTFVSIGSASGGFTATGDGLTHDGTTVNLQLDGSSLSKGGSGLKVADNGVGIAQLTGLTRGTLFVGDLNGDPSVKAAGTSGQVFQADGSTDPQWVTLSGDVTIAAGGAVTIANDAVENAMLATNSVSTVKIQDNAVNGQKLAAGVAGRGINLTSNELRANNHLVKAPCAYVTVGALDTYTYNGGAGTLTKDTNGALTVDGASPAVGDRILVTGTGTTADSHNGIYDVTNTGSGAAQWVLTRSSDCDATGDFGIHSEVWVMEGSTKSGSKWYLSGTDGDEDNININTGTKEFTEISLGASVSGGDGISVSSNTVTVDLATASALSKTTETDKLSVSVDDSSIEISSNALQVKASGIATAMIADNAVTGAKIAAAAIGTGLHFTSDVINVALLAKDPVRLATTGALGSVTVGGSGVGKTLTNNGAQAALQIDGVTTVVGDRILVKNEAAAVHNGIYTVTTVGDGSTNWVLTRATDADQNDEVNIYMHTHVLAGSTLTKTAWVLTTTSGPGGAITVDTHTQIFSQMLAHPATLGTSQASRYLSLDGSSNCTAGTLASISGSGTSTFATHTSTSDQRLKRKIRTIEPEEGLEVIKKSRGVRFEWKKNGKVSSGVIAQEAQKLVPELVLTSKGQEGEPEDKLSMNYEGYTGYMIPAIQALAKQVEELKAQVCKCKDCDCCSSSSSSSSSKKRKASQSPEGGDQKR